MTDSPSSLNKSGSSRDLNGSFSRSYTDEGYCCPCRRLQGVLADEIVGLSQKIEIEHFEEADSINLLRLAGHAEITEDALRLTDCAPWQHGSAWFLHKKLMGDGFVVDFDFTMRTGADGQSADGFAFVIQDSPSGLDAVGEYGEGIGYQGISRALAIEFDTFYNPHLDTGVPDHGCHVSIQSCGKRPLSADHMYSLALATNIGNLADGQEHHARIAYNGKAGRLQLDLDHRPLLTCEVSFESFAPTGYLGWTGSTGQHMETHDVKRFSYYWGGGGDDHHVGKCDCHCHGEACPDCGAAIPSGQLATHAATCEMSVPADKLRDTTECQYCHALFQKQRLAAHESLCDQRPEGCVYCGIMFSSHDIFDHESACERRVDPCPYCGVPTSPREWEKHLKRCTKRHEECGHCGERVPALNISGHQDVCDHRRVACAYCEVQFKIADVDAHKRACSRRPESCFYCGKMVPADEVAVHQDSCDRRMIACPHCKTPYSARDKERYNTHLSVCDYKQESCRFCGHPHPRRDIATHEEECESRPVSCPYCRTAVSLTTLASHKRSCQERPQVCTECGERFPFREMMAHQADCAKLACGACGVIFGTKELPAHMQMCPKRVKACQHCGIGFPSAELQRHLTSCAARPVCPNCGQPCSDGLERHIVACQRKLQEEALSRERFRTAALLAELRAEEEQQKNAAAELARLRTEAAQAISDETSEGEACTHCGEPCPSLAALEQHEVNCEKRTETCPACSERVFTRDMPLHRNRCPNMERCILCNGLFTPSEFNEHECKGTALRTADRSATSLSLGGTSASSSSMYAASERTLTDEGSYTLVSQTVEYPYMGSPAPMMMRTPSSPSLGSIPLMPTGARMPMIPMGPAMGGMGAGMGPAMGPMGGGPPDYFVVKRRRTKHRS